LRIFETIYSSLLLSMF